MSIVGISPNQRRRLGRRGNPNQKPADTTVKIKKEVLDDIDLLIQIPRMPLGLKIESMVRELKLLRKNSVGLTKNQAYQHQEYLINNINSINTNESYDYDESAVEKQFDEELKVLRKQGLL